MIIINAKKYMTNLLKQAIEKSSKLSDEEQNKIAQMILDEISDEEKWNSRFSNTQEGLSLLADKAIKDYKGGKTKPSND
jgi:polyhydroxyalkanoate synthesis regulator phasin